MARTGRQLKLIEIINKNEIETHHKNGTISNSNQVKKSAIRVH